jgi:predicted transcriptional regulator with HTH domain
MATILAFAYLEETIRYTRTRVSAFVYLEEISRVDRQDKNARICILGTDNRYEQTDG